MNYNITGQTLLQTFAADTHTLLFILGIDGKILDVNWAFTQQTGFSEEELKQTYIWKLLLKDEAQLESTFSRKPFHSHKPLFYSHHWLNKNKEPVFIEWSGSPLMDETHNVLIFICLGKDLTAYKHTEAVLKAKEDKLEQLQRISKTGYWEHDLVKDTVILSFQTAEIYNFPYEKASLPGSSSHFNFSQKPFLLDDIYHLVIEPEKEEFMENLQRIMEAKQPFQWNYTVEVKGEMKRIYVEGEFMFDAAGKPVRLMGITQDITQKFEYEQKLKYKEKLLDTISEAVISTDTEFTITSWNKGAQQIYGWTAVEAVGKKVSSLLKTAFLEGSDLSSALKEMNEKGVWFNQVVQTHKNGHPIHIMSNTSKVLDEKNRHIGFVGVNQDITRLVKIEKELLSNQANLLAIIENTPDSLYLLDTDFRMIMMNSSSHQSLYHRFGITIAKGDKITDKLPAPVAQHIEFTLNKALKGKEFMLEITYMDQDEKEQIIESVVYPIKDKLSEVVGIAVYNRNITDRKRIQEEILSLQIESEKVQAAALLEGQEGERKRLLKELHDGIGQMLQVLKLKIDTLKDKFPQIYAPLDDIAGLLSQTISDVNSLIYDSMPYSLENLGLEGAIRALAEQYQYNTRLHLQFQLWFNLTDIAFEKALQIYIYRILQECLNNIAKHAQATHVTVQLTQLPNGLLLMVEDDGIGFNLEEKLKQKPASSGLKNLIERCKLIHAEIDIDTLPGHGCTINIIFPL